MKNRWLSVDEIAEYIGVSRDTIYAWLKDKRMPGHRAGHMWKFKMNEVDEWLQGGGASNQHWKTECFNPNIEGDKPDPEGTNAG